MLLHNLYINVAIAVLLLYRKSLYDDQEPKYKNPTFAPNIRVITGCARGPLKSVLQVQATHLNDSELGWPQQQ